MRWLRELRRPALKCERVGHKPRAVKRAGYSVPSEWGVADSVLQGGQVCDRCGVMLVEWKTIKREAIQGLTMPASDWDQLKEQGFLER